MTSRIDADLLIPGRGEPVEHGSVVMDGGGIVFAGSSAAAPAVDGAVVEVATVLPGLWECHGHFTGLTTPDIETLATEPVALLAARATADVEATLMGGITSVREVGGLGIYIRHAVDEGRLAGPHIYSAGSILSMTGGHVDIHGMPLDWIQRLSDSDGFGVLCDGVPECLRAVRRQLRKGARVIKVCASGGVASELDHPVHQQFSDDELRVIVEEASRAEVAVAAHCHGKPGIMAAIEAGVKTIEHGSYLDEEAADAMVETDTMLVPTRFVVAELLKMEDVLPPHGYRKGVMVSEHHERAMKIAVAAGVKMATGTDIIISGDLFKKATREIVYLIEAGLPPIDAIEAATANGPDTLGAQAPLSGQLKEDYDADVIALDFNPLEDWAKWGDPDRVIHVWKGGAPVKA